MNARKAIVGMLAAVLLCVLSAKAQDRWDIALDRYERICNDCLKLRETVSSGGSVGAVELNSLLQELSRLRSTLRDAEGRMSAPQKARFQRIRERYGRIAAGKRPAQEKPAVEERLAPVSLTVPQLIPFPESRTVIPPKGRTGSPGPLLPKQYGRPGQGLQWSLAGFCVIPEICPGLMLSARRGTAGAYIKASASAQWKTAAGTCYSDGTVPGGGVIWTDGKDVTNRFCVSAGGIYRLFYAGLGYGRSRRLWKDAAGQWLEVTDLSHKGLAAEAGIIVPISRISVIAGASTIGFSTFSADIGVGIRF